MSADGGAFKCQYDELEIECTFLTRWWVKIPIRPHTAPLTLVVPRYDIACVPAYSPLLLGTARRLHDGCYD